MTIAYLLTEMTIAYLLTDDPKKLLLQGNELVANQSGAWIRFVSVVVAVVGVIQVAAAAAKDDDNDDFILLVLVDNEARVVLAEETDKVGEGNEGITDS